MGRLDELDLSLRLGPPLCVLFEGWDASGKGGAIKRLVERVEGYASPAQCQRAYREICLLEETLHAEGCCS